MPKLYRVFREMTHAREFLDGEVRFGHLGYYRDRERDGGRADRSEGHAHHTEFRPDRMAVRLSREGAEEIASPGIVSVRTDCGNDVFVCCLTLPPSEAAWKRVREDFGDVVVEVDAERLLADVRSALNPHDGWQRGASVMFWPAEYTKGLERKVASREERANQAVRLAATQKPPAYAHQYEHRITLISCGAWEQRGAAPSFLTVRIPHRLEYAQISSVRLATAP